MNLSTAAPTAARSVRWSAFSICRLMRRSRSPASTSISTSTEPRRRRARLARIRSEAVGRAVTGASTALTSRVRADVAPSPSRGPGRGDSSTAARTSGSRVMVVGICIRLCIHEKLCLGQRNIARGSHRGDEAGARKTQYCLVTETQKNWRTWYSFTPAWQLCPG